MICANPYDNAEHQLTQLPCSHYFCLICLLKLQKQGSSKCPTCTISFEELIIKNDLNITLPDYESDTENLLDAKQEARRKHVLSTCSTHDMKYTFWCLTCKKFCCNKCITTTHKTCENVIMEEAAEAIQADMEGAIEFTQQQIDVDIASLTDAQGNAKEVLCVIREYKQLLTNLEAKQVEHFKAVQQLFIKRKKDEDAIVKMKEDLSRIAKEIGGAWLVKDVEDSLKRMNKSNEIPSNDVPNTLLYHIAHISKVVICNYVITLYL